MNTVNFRTLRMEGGGAQWLQSLSPYPYGGSSPPLIKIPFFLVLFDNDLDNILHFFLNITCLSLVSFKLVEM